MFITRVFQAASRDNALNMTEELVLERILFARIVCIALLEKSPVEFTRSIL